MRRLILSACLVSALAVPALAQTGPITLDHVWARATPPGAKTGAIYMTITDTGAPDRLTGASTPVAATAEVHETTNDNGVMRMRPVGSLFIQPGKPVTFRPGGYHLMLTGLKQPLTAGQSFPVTLTFEHAGPVSATVTVEKIGAGSMSGMHMH
jgi:copper(I)-binding protein